MDALRYALGAMPMPKRRRWRWDLFWGMWLYWFPSVALGCLSGIGAGALLFHIPWSVVWPMGLFTSGVAVLWTSILAFYIAASEAARR
jgi:hypothetical protein